MVHEHPLDEDASAPAQPTDTPPVPGPPPGVMDEEPDEPFVPLAVMNPE